MFQDNGNNKPPTKKQLINDIQLMNINDRTQFLIEEFTQNKLLKYFIYKKIKLLHSILVFYHYNENNIDIE
jgi:hypothetical protein